jgi:tripartite-type tricarboxylate transporter receptor subunit TctC
MTLFRSLALLVCLGAASGAEAQTYPNKPIRMVVGYSAGGSVDVVGRLLGQELTKALGQPIVIDNKAGASGNIGTDFVAKSAPDGYTLLMGSAAALAANPSLYKQLPFDPIRDLAPISLIAIQPNVLLVHPSVPVATVAELIAYAKAHPGTLNYATSGTGSSQHMAGALFQQMTKIDILHVPYRGGAPASADLIAGQVQIIFQTAPEAMPLIGAKQARAIAVTTKKRVPALPDLPTIAEAGVPGYQSTGWLAVAAPAATPAAIIERLNAELVKITRAPEVRARLFDLGLDVIGSSPDELARFMKDEAASFHEVVTTTHITID